MIEEQFEKCSWADATHVEMGGKLHELGYFAGEREVLKYNSHHINVCRKIEVHTTETSWQLIHVDAFPILGIKPLKKKPIKFYHTFGGPYAPPNEAYGKTFLCVEFLKEGKK